MANSKQVGISWSTQGAKLRILAEKIDNLIMEDEEDQDDDLDDHSSHEQLHRLSPEQMAEEARALSTALFNDAQSLETSSGLMAKSTGRLGKLGRQLAYDVAREKLEVAALLLVQASALIGSAQVSVSYLANDAEEQSRTEPKKGKA